MEYLVTNGHIKNTKKVESDWLQSIKTLILYLALESDAINANFDLVYSDDEIETHVRAIAQNGRLFDGIPQDRALQGFKLSMLNGYVFG